MSIEEDKKKAKEMCITLVKLALECRDAIDNPTDSKYSRASIIEDMKEFVLELEEMSERGVFKE